jgi:hypothetical protein
MIGALELGPRAVVGVFMEAAGSEPVITPIDPARKE